MKDITICDKHPDYEVPLIWTLAFEYNEKYWCPYCGNKQNEKKGIEVEATPELIKRLEDYRTYSTDFMKANGMLEFRLKSQLSKKEKEKLQKAKDNWVYQRKIEDLLNK